jgi:hypothetical protein
MIKIRPGGPLLVYQKQQVGRQFFAAPSGGVGRLFHIRGSHGKIQSILQSGFLM